MFGFKKKEDPGMYVIAGLGNPEAKYAGTRHNTGYDIIDELSDRYNIRVNKNKHRALIGKGKIEGMDVLLVKPVTYMNLSGESLKEVTDYYKTDIKDHMIVIYDDVDLDVGRIRIRESGSAGGHNGMKNIIERLSTKDFIRLRVGVGHKPEGYDLIDWVLGRFSGEDKEIMRNTHPKAADAVVSILQDGVSKAMSRYNG